MNLGNKRFSLKSLVALCLTFAIMQAHAESIPSASSSEQDRYHQKGREIYNYRCYFCHGYSGDARTLTTTFITPQPRDFTRTEIDELSREYMLGVVAKGKPETAMTGFSRVLNATDIEAVVDFVRTEFMLNKQPNTRYHTVENGWPEHQRYQIAFPFATGEIPLDASSEKLTPYQERGRQLFLSSCITCHDRAKVIDEGAVWKKQSISYPRNNYSHTRIDAVSSASIYAIHDISPTVDNLSEDEVAGKELWLKNCAFCHAADGSGENWIGSFLEPSPRNLNSPEFMSGMSRDVLVYNIQNGLENTSMPAWKSVLSERQIHQVVSYILAAFYALDK